MDRIKAPSFLFSLRNRRVAQSSNPQGMMEGRRALLEHGLGQGEGARNGYLNRFGGRGNGRSGEAAGGRDGGGEGGYFSLTDDEEEPTMAGSPMGRGRTREEDAGGDEGIAREGRGRSQSPSRSPSRSRSRSRSRSATLSPSRRAGRGESTSRWDGGKMRDTNILSTSYADMYSMGGRTAALREARRIAVSGGHVALANPPPRATISRHHSAY